MVLGNKILIGASGDGRPDDSTSVIYSLRRPDYTIPWTNSVAKLYRTADGATAWLFLENNTTPAKDDTIDLTGSLISTVSNIIPSATTLTSWVGGGQARVIEWIGMTPNNLIDSNKTVSQANFTNMPNVVDNSGIILVRNGKPTIVFVNPKWLKGAAISALDPGASFTIIAVSWTTVGTGPDSILHTKDNVATDNGARFQLLHERGANKRLGKTRSTGGVNTDINFISQQNNTNQWLTTITSDGSELKGYFKTVLQDTETISTPYINDALTLGAFLGGSSLGALNGGEQEIKIYPSKLVDAELLLKQNEIINYYSIP